MMLLAEVSDAVKIAHAACEAVLTIGFLVFAYYCFFKED